VGRVGNCPPRFWKSRRRRITNCPPSFGKPLTPLPIHRSVQYTQYFRIFSNMRLMDPEPIIFTMLVHALTGVWHQLGIGATNWIKRIIIPFLNYVGSLALMEISKVEEKWRIYSCTKKYSKSYELVWWVCSINCVNIIYYNWHPLFALSK
jgi:hypothetical protein